MTNKLLTLEEIEEIENSAKEDLDQWQETTMHLSKVLALLATARAYWELNKKEVHVSCSQCGLSTIIEVPHAGLPQLADDKPHLPTLKVIVEAMKEMLSQYHFANSNLECADLATVVQSLEKHLE